MYLAIITLSAMFGGTSPVSSQPTHPDTACPSRNVPLNGRKSPLDSLSFSVARQPVKVCYGLTVGGLRVDPGVYSLYTVPGPREWEIIVNRSVKQWGEEHEYTKAVQAQEVGRAKVKSESSSSPIETFTIRAEPDGNDAGLVLEWEKTKVLIPFKAAK
jgi:hypothetical protein